MTVRAWRFMMFVGFLSAVASKSTYAQRLPKLITLDSTGRITYFIADGIERSFYRPGDRQLAIWALEEWQRAAGKIHFDGSNVEGRSLLRLYWVPWRAGELGVERTILSNRLPAAIVFIAPDVRENAVGSATARAVRADPLLRDTIVYLLCLHEIGHGLGLGHTADSNDVMHAGGRRDDNLRVFQQYRRRFSTRASMRTTNWLSNADKRRVAELYSR